MSTASSSRWTFPATCALAVAVVVGAYSNSFQNSFHFDDSHVIVENLYIRSLTNVPRFFRDAATFSSLPSNATYRPLVTTTLALDYWLGGGLQVAQFHRTQLAMLLVLGAMLYAFFVRILDSAGERPWNRLVALGAATLFAVHTANTETINSIAARSELLAAIGVVGSFLVYSYLPRLRHTYLYLLPMAVGALAKTPAVFFAPLFLVYVCLIEKNLSVGEIVSRTAWPRTRAALVKTVPAFAVGGALYAAVESLNAPTVNYGGGSRLEYLQTQLFVWLHYVRLFFLPIGLSADTDWRLIPQWYDTRVIAGALFVGLLVAIVWTTSRAPRTRPIAFGVAWFCIALIPGSSIVPLAEVMNEHRIFFPYIGLALAVAWAVALLFERWREAQPARARLVATLAWTVGVLAIGAQAAGAYARNTVWRSEETLWRDVVEKSPANGRGLMNYGLTQMARGKYVEAHDLFVRAKQYTPNYGTLEVNLGIVTDRLGQPAEAEQHFVKALELAPGDPASHSFYGRWLVERGRSREAIGHLKQAIALSPALLTSRLLLLNLYYAAGDAAALDQLVRDTLAVAPTEPAALAFRNGSVPATAGSDGGAASHYTQGRSLTGMGRHVDAAMQYRYAVKLDPQLADAYNDLGWSLGKAGLFNEAVAPLEQAIRLRPDNLLARNNLAWVQAQAAAAR